MARLPEILDPNQLPENQRDLFEYLAGTRGSVRPPFSIIMNSPEVARRVSHLGTYLRFESALPRALSEIAICATAREFDCQTEWRGHSNLARENGVSEASLDIIANRRPVEELPEGERLPVQVARDLVRNHAISDEAFAEAQQRFGEAGAVDLFATVGYYSMMACLLNALQIAPPEGTPGLLPV
jgi:4-carboxymuconolactone decarboxylase